METAADRISRMFENGSCSDVIPPTSYSNNSKGVLGNDANFIAQSCKKIITSGPISQVRIKNALKASKRGQHMLKKYTVSQLISRVKYEHKKICKPSFFKI